MIVTEIKTKGSDILYGAWVESYKLQYSMDGNKWTSLNNDQPYRGNSDEKSCVSNLIGQVRC